MVRPRRYTRALVVAVGALLTCAGLALTTASPAPAAPAAAPALPPDTAPLKVRIDTMSPSALPADGPIEITGRVTNRSEETWSSISLYAFMGDRINTVPVEPMRTTRQLDEALAVPFDEVVGDRVLVGRFGRVAELRPGQTASYSIRVPVSALQVTRPGVYWFGVHALGQSDSSPLNDATADGRARTFLPFVPERFDSTPVPTALVVPLTRPVEYAADGSVDDVDAWTEALGPDGALTRVLDFVGTGGGPVTWVVDPALLDAVGRLAAGNPPRSLGPPGGGPSGTASPGEEATGSPAPDEEAASSPGTEASQAATAWLDRLRSALAGDQVLALPYGNIDVPATLEHAPALYDLAQAQQSTVLQSLGVESTRAVAPPSGFLDEASLAAVDDERVIVTDRMFPGDPPAVAEVDGRELVVSSYAATQGSPGPGPRTTTVGLRQRLLAEAAVRLFRSGPEPLVVDLPTDGRLTDPSGFFSGLDVPWFDLDTVDSVAGTATPEPVAAADLEYAPRQVRRELDAGTVEGVADLVGAGDSLQTLLADNNEVGGTIAEEALTGLSYWVRDDQPAGRARTASALGWVQRRLDGVTIDASSGVTLSSTTGEFGVTVSNDLDYAVTVQIRAESDSGIVIASSPDIELAPGSRSNVFLEARTNDNRVHDVRLLLTDTAGVPIGSSDQVPIRSAQVSDVIWLIMGTGAGLLFLAIAVRLVRRIRAARQGDQGDAGDRASAEAPAPVEAV